MLEHSLNSTRQIADKILNARRQYFALNDLGFMVLPLSPGLKL